MATAYSLNAYQVNFASVYTVQEESLAKMFKYLEASGIRIFLEAYAIIFKTHLLDFYA